MDIHLKRFEGIFNGMRRTRIVKETYTEKKERIKMECVYEYPYN